MADAGRAMMLYKGVYDSTYTYEKLDVVNYNGSLYISNTDGNLGTVPADETKWKLFLQGGTADNIQATDTHGIAGTAGESSFVQLLLDALAANTVRKSNILNTMEEIEANTSGENISGALAVNALKNNFANSLADVNSNLQNHLGLGGIQSRGFWLNNKEDCDNFFSSKAYSIAPFVTTIKVDYLPARYLNGIKWENTSGECFDIIAWNNISVQLYVGRIKFDDFSQASWRTL